MDCCFTKSCFILLIVLFILWKFLFKKTKSQKLNKFLIEKIIQTNKNEVEKECVEICHALSNEPVVVDEAEVDFPLSLFLISSSRSVPNS
jgi:hypothetical protein